MKSRGAVEPVTEFGEMEVHVSEVLPGELTTKSICPLTCPSGFCTRTFQVSAVVLVVIGTVNCVEFTKLAFVLVFVNVYPLRSEASCVGVRLRRFDQAMVSCW